MIPQRPDPCPLGTSPIRHPNSGTTDLRERRALRHFQPQYSSQKLPEHPLPRLGGVWGLLAISHEYWKNRYQPGAALPADLLGAVWAWESIRAEHSPWGISPGASAMDAYYARRIEETGVIIDG